MSDEPINPRYAEYLRFHGFPSADYVVDRRKANTLPYDQWYSPWIQARWKEWYAHVNSNPDNAQYCRLVGFPINDPRAIRIGEKSGYELFDEWLPGRVNEMLEGAQP